LSYGRIQVLYRGQAIVAIRGSDGRR